MADRIKKLPKSALERKSMERLTIEDDTHESEISRGEVFYTSSSPRGNWIYDVSDPKSIFRFKVDQQTYRNVNLRSYPVGDIRTPAKQAAAPKKVASKKQVAAKKTKSPAQLTRERREKLREAESVVIGLRKEYSSALSELKRAEKSGEDPDHIESIEKKIRRIKAKVSDATKTVGSMNGLSQFSHFNFKL